MTKSAGKCLTVGKIICNIRSIVFRYLKTAMFNRIKTAAAANTVAFTLIFAPGAPAYPQREAMPPAQVTSPRPHGQFLNRLQRIFGRFRNVDLERAFDTAPAVRCSELVSGTGEWHEVAFFNEYRPFGDWHRRSLEGVKRGFAAYIFTGACKELHSSVQVTTRFPVDAALKDYQNGRIPSEDVVVKVNPPVTARFDSQTGTYTFELPYLFRVPGREAMQLYALNPRTSSDRYAADVTSRWECKSIADQEGAYQFLICHTRLFFQNQQPDNRRGDSFGTSAFSILSDGREGSSSVQLVFH